jgi:outer membrane protein
LRHRILISALVVLLGVAADSSAQGPGWRYGGRVSWVNSSAGSDELGDTGVWLDLQSGLGVEFDATLLFTDRFAVELSIGASAPRLQIRGDASGDIDGGRLWLFPLSAIGQYHHPVYGHWDPYVGLGVSWAVPFYDLPQAAEDAGYEDINFESGPAVVGQLGVNYQVDNRWYVNLDLRYFNSSLDVRVNTEDEDFPTVTLDTSPVVVSLGFGYKF